MDLAAYADMGRLERIVRKNGIKIPRERGYRLMSEQKIIPLSDYDKSIKSMAIQNCQDLICAYPKYSTDPNYHIYSGTTERQIDKYIKDDKIQWSLIHGKFRRNLKFAIKRSKKAIAAQYDTFNKYVGHKDVLMVHARIGSQLWVEFSMHREVGNKPWFIEKVDDYFDQSYCDIYCRIEAEQ